MTSIDIGKGKKESLIGLGAVLSETSRKYRRSFLAVCLVLITAFFLKDLVLEKANFLGMPLGKYAWEFGLLFLLYFGSLYWFNSLNDLRVWKEKIPTNEDIDFFRLIMGKEVLAHLVTRKEDKEVAIKLSLERGDYYCKYVYNPSLRKGHHALRRLRVNEVDFVKYEWRFFQIFDVWAIRIIGPTALIVNIIKLNSKYLIF